MHTWNWLIKLWILAEKKTITSLKKSVTGSGGANVLGPTWPSPGVGISSMSSAEQLRKFVKQFKNVCSCLLC